MKIFISYSSKDRPIVENMFHALQQDGHKVFFDRNNLEPGDEYNKKIRTAIDDSDIFIFMITNNSIKDGSYALTELEFAKERWPVATQNILPVLLNGDVVTKNIPAYLLSVTFLEPSGNVTAEVLAAVEKMKRRRSVIRRVAVPLVLVVIVGYSLFYLTKDYLWTRDVASNIKERVNNPEITITGQINPVDSGSLSLYFGVITPIEVKEIFYKLPNQTNYTSMGMYQIAASSQRNAIPRNDIKIPLSQEKINFNVKLIDKENKEHGPFFILFDPVQSLIASCKNMKEVSGLKWATISGTHNERMFATFNTVVCNGALKYLRYSINNKNLDMKFGVNSPWPNVKSIEADWQEGQGFYDLPLETKNLFVQPVYMDDTEGFIEDIMPDS